MPNPGGASGKIGDLYEALWTVEIALDVFEGRLTSIIVEAFGDESRGVEFQTFSNSRVRQFHSVKRQKVDGDWSIADLCFVKNSRTGRSILGDLFEKYSLWPDCETCFVSATGANELRELTERARTFTTSSDFRSQLPKKLRSEFDKRLVPLCGNDPKAAIAALTSLQVRLRDHFGLADTIERRIDLLLYRVDSSELRPGDVRRMLAEYLVENLGVTVTTDQLRDFVKSQGIGIRDWKLDLTVREAVQKANQRYRSVTERELINDAHIVRDAVSKITASLTHADSRGILVIAPGGYGKSCVLAQTLEQLSKQGTPFLCMRMDSFDPCRTTKQLGKQMDLPESPTVVLAGVADNAPSVLVVDQLDAMSLVSGRNPQMWDVFEQLTREVKSFSHMKLLLACRDFDLNHDHRLRSLGSEQSSFHKLLLSLLSSDEVSESLARASLTNVTLPDSSIEILRVPFHLLLFLQGDPSCGFITVGELYNRYWERKRQNLRETLGREPRWNEVIDALASRMSERQLLFASMAVVGNWTEDAKAMASENVLVEDSEQRQYRFFHESFFDYAYARRFCETEGDVISLLESSEQHLFRRAQVRQILAYRRENDFGQYIEDIGAIFNAPMVRFHIKRMVAAGFRSLAKPKGEEWRILEPLLFEGDLSSYVAIALRDHVGWFDLLDSLGVFTEWLASEDSRLVDMAIWFLELDELHKARSAQIARHIAPFAECDGAWRTRILRIMSWGKARHSPEMTTIYLGLIARGFYDDFTSQVIGSDFWSEQHDSEEDSPEFLIDVLATWLDRTARMFDDGSWNFLDKCPLDNSHSGAVMVSNSATAAPEYFIKRMLPLVKGIVIQSALEHAGEVYDRAWPWLSNYGDPFDIHGAVLLSLRRALQWLAKTNPDKFRQYSATLLAAPHRTFSYLLLRAWADNPQEFADECAAYLIADQRRLNIGYSSWSGDSEGSGESAISRIALQEISPYCSADLLTGIEIAIIGYCDEYEKSTPRWRGSSELLRLRSLDRKRISQKASLRLEELERKFPKLLDAIVPEDESRLLKSTGSSISQSSARKMNDDQWISAMRKYDHTTDRFRGGPSELSRMLAEFTKEDPQRFAALINRIPNDVDPIYFSGILDGLCSRNVKVAQAEKGADKKEVESLPTELFTTVIERLHQLPDQPCGSAIVGCIGKLASRSLPDGFLDIVAYYAKHDPDPEEDIWKGTENGLKYHGGDPYSHGINCVRGQACVCIGKLLFADEARLQQLRPVLIAIANDPVISVRACAITCFISLLNFARDFAVELFLVACEACEAICATAPFDDFVHYASFSHYGALRELLQFALNSSEPIAVRNAAQRIILAELSDLDVGHDAAGIRIGSELMRKAAAHVYSFNISHDQVGDRCADHLKKFFDDDSEAVRKEVSNAFVTLSGSKLLHFEEFISEYIESRSFENNTERLLHALKESNVELPHVVCRAAERILEFVGNDGADAAQRGARIAYQLSTLVVRQYEQAKDATLRKRCLDIIDRMERIGYHGISEELAKLDR